ALLLLLVVAEDLPSAEQDEQQRPLVEEEREVDPHVPLEKEEEAEEDHQDAEEEAAALDRHLVRDEVRFRGAGCVEVVCLAGGGGGVLSIWFIAISLMRAPLVSRLSRPQQRKKRRFGSRPLGRRSRYATRAPASRRSSRRTPGPLPRRTSRGRAARTR